MSSRPEAELILCCARTRQDPRTAERIRVLLARPIDWGLLIRAAAPQGVTPFLYTALKEAGAEEVPQAVMQSLEDFYRTNAQQNLVWLRDLLGLVDLFEAHDIRAIPFKGPLLALSVYQSLATRQFHDLDILVHPRDVERAKTLLLSRGYQLQWHVPDWEYHFTNDRGGSPVDLHERIASPAFRERLAFDELWAGLVPVQVSGKPVLTLGAPHLLLVLSLQLAKDCRGWKQRLVQVCDVAELIRCSPGLDWDLTLRKAGEAGSLRILLLSLELANTLLDAPLPGTVPEVLRANPVVPELAAEVRARLFPEVEGPSEAVRYRTDVWYEDAAFYMRVRERQGDKLAYLQHFLRDQLLREPRFLRLSPSLRVLYHVLRPARLLVERARTRSTSRGSGPAADSTHRVQ